MTFVQNDGHALATCGCIFVNVFYAPPTVARLDELHAYQLKLLERVKRHAVVTIIDPGVGKEMADDARKRARVIATEMEPFTIGQSFIVLGSGFFAAMTRSVIAGIQLVSRARAPWRVTSDHNDAVSFIAELVRAEGHSVDEAALRAIVAQMMVAPGAGPARGARAAS